MGTVFAVPFHLVKMYENFMIFLLLYMKENCKIFSGLVKKLSVGSDVDVSA